MEYIAPYWECNKCENISSKTYICDCKECFRCTKCSFLNEINFSNIGDQYLMCNLCGNNIRTIIGLIPNRWEEKTEDGKKNLYIDFCDYSGDSEYVKRNIKIKLNLTSISNINQFISNLIDIDYINEANFTLTQNEICYIYALIILFYPGTPSNCRCMNCFLSKTIKYRRLQNFMTSNPEHENFNKFVLCDKYISMYLNRPPPITFSFNVQNIQNVLDSSMEDEVPQYSATTNVIDKINQNSTEYSKIEGEKDSSCVICFCDYNDEDKVSQLECCNKILHTKCILNWFTEYNHTCPLCNHKYEHEDKPNNVVINEEDDEEDDEEDTVDLGYIDDGSIDVEDSDDDEESGDDEVGDSNGVQEDYEDVANDSILGDYDSDD